MISLGVSNITVEYGIDTIIENISFSINDGERVGVVGKNGCGKSTLLKVIAGKTNHYTGDVFVDKQFRISMLEQNEMLNSSLSIIDEMTKTFSHLVDMEAQIDSLSNSSRMEDIETYTNLLEKFTDLGGLEYKNRIKVMLTKLGFDESRFDNCINQLSGGERTRLALAKILLMQPEILLLDEPTNHLDNETLQWLESALLSYQHSIIVVSHDRYFLDKIATKILEIENHKATLYNGNYSYYKEKKQTDFEILEKHYKNQQKEIERIEAHIAQQRQWNREKNIKTAESKEKQLQRMEKIEKPIMFNQTIKFDFDSAEETGNDVIIARNISKSFESNLVLKDISFDVKRKDRVLIIGPNGCGKSTLIKIIANIITDYDGDLFLGSNVKIGYYNQDLQTLNESNTVLEELYSVDKTLPTTKARNMLASFLFLGDDVFKEIRTLSGGEKARLSLCKLLLTKINVLVLDEPTNHLDIDSKEILEAAILNFPGTTIAVSHDRYFINKIGTKIYDLTNGNITCYDGNYNEYLEFKETRQINPVLSVPKTKIVSDNKQKFEDNKKLISEIRKNENIIKNSEIKITELDNKKAILEEESLGQSSTNYVRLTEIQNEISAIDEEINLLFEKIEEAENKLAELKKD